jgi:hypothetical protein
MAAALPALLGTNTPAGTEPTSDSRTPARQHTWMLVGLQVIATRVERCFMALDIPTLNPSHPSILFLLRQTIYARLLITGGYFVIVFIFVLRDKIPDEVKPIPQHIIRECPLFYQTRVNHAIHTYGRTIAYSALYNSHPHKLLSFLRDSRAASRPPDFGPPVEVAPEPD